MTKIASRGTSARKTTRAIDVTGHENLMLLLPNPGAELAFGPFIAELCARGRPPFVAILGDGAHDGSNTLANILERKSRKALSVLGVPDDRVLFVGLRMGSIPTDTDALFKALLSAMALLNWRKDCNVVGASAPGGDDVDGVATWQVAQAVAERHGLRLVVRGASGADDPVEAAWEFDGTAWLTIAAGASEMHRGCHGEGDRGLSRFHSLLFGGSANLNLC